jgi:hypothetical protein
MQSYYTNNESSIRKMHGQDPSMLRGRPYGSSGGFDFGNIVGDPFALATVSISIVSASAAAIPFVPRVPQTAAPFNRNNEARETAC